MVDIAQLRKNEAEVSIKFAGEDIKAWFRPAVLTMDFYRELRSLVRKMTIAEEHTEEELDEEAQYAKDDLQEEKGLASVIGVFSKVVSRWDVLEDGVMFPIQPDTYVELDGEMVNQRDSRLRELPLIVLVMLLDQVMENIVPPNRRGTSSEPSVASVRSLPGTGSFGRRTTTG